MRKLLHNDRRILHVVLVAITLNFLGSGSSSGKVLFLAHYNGSNADADYAIGSMIDESGFRPGTTALGKWGRAMDLTNATKAGCWYDGASNLNPLKGTVDFWYCITENAAGMYHPMFGWYNMPVFSGQPRNTAFEVYTQDTGMTLGLYAPYNGTTVGGFNPDVGNWHHIEINWDCTGGDGTSTYNVYIDGQNMVHATDKLALKSPGGKIVVGLWDYAHGHFLHGKVDELRITDQVEHTGNFTPPTGEYAAPGTPASVAESYSLAVSNLNNLKSNIDNLVKAIQLAEGMLDSNEANVANATEISSTAAAEEAAATIGAIGEQLRSAMMDTAFAQDVQLGQFTVTATRSVDFVEDGIVNFKDFAVFAESWQTSTGQENWNILCDLHRDGHIDYADLAEFIYEWLW